MPHIKIREMDGRVATSGIHLGGGPERRKLEPGEVIDLEEGELFDLVWATGKVELTVEPVTRPVDFEDEIEARYTSPTFKARSDEEEEKRIEYVEQMMDRLYADANIREDEPEPVGTAEPPPEPEVDVGALHRQIADLQAQLSAVMDKKADAPAESRRAARRARIAAARGQKSEALSG